MPAELFLFLSVLGRSSCVQNSNSRTRIFIKSRVDSIRVHRPYMQKSNYRTRNFIKSRVDSIHVHRSCMQNSNSRTRILIRSRVDSIHVPTCAFLRFMSPSYGHLTTASPCNLLITFTKEIAYGWPGGILEHVVPRCRATAHLRVQGA